MCRLLKHEIEAVAAAACIVVTNLAKDGNIQEGIACVPFVPSALLCLTFSDNRIETQVFYFLLSLFFFFSYPILVCYSIIGAWVGWFKRISFLSNFFSSISC